MPDPLTEAQKLQLQWKQTLQGLGVQFTPSQQLQNNINQQRMKDMQQRLSFIQKQTQQKIYQQELSAKEQAALQQNPTMIQNQNPNATTNRLMNITHMMLTMAKGDAAAFKLLAAEASAFLKGKEFQEEEDQMLESESKAAHKGGAGPRAMNELEASDEVAGLNIASVDEDDDGEVTKDDIDRIERFLVSKVPEKEADEFVAAETRKRVMPELEVEGALEKLEENANQMRKSLAQLAGATPVGGAAKPVSREPTTMLNRAKNPFDISSGPTPPDR